MNPKPGEPFEAYGLTWEPLPPITVPCHRWRATVDGCAMWLTDHGGEGWSIATLNTRSVSSQASASFLPLESALAWAIRTCPGARCGTCAHAEREDGDLVRIGKRGELICCNLRRHGEPEDGWCHRWEARR